MPAIQPARLSRQILDLVELFGSPDEFVANLHMILDFYADRTLRPGQVIESAPLLHNYRVPRPVIRRLERGFVQHAQKNPAAALQLVDALWEDRWVETRLLAVAILGNVPPTPPQPVIERAQSWGASCREELIIDALVLKGLHRLRLEAQSAFVLLLETWLASHNPGEVRVGLRALPSLLNEESFENLPAVFRWITPLVREVTLEQKDDLARALGVLIRRSSHETAYFLRQILTSSVNSRAASMIRQVLHEFPPEFRAGIRELVREPQSAK